MCFAGKLPACMPDIDAGWVTNVRTSRSVGVRVPVPRRCLASNAWCKLSFVGLLLYISSFKYIIVPLLLMCALGKVSVNL